MSLLEIKNAKLKLDDKDIMITKVAKDAVNNCNVLKIVSVACLK